MSEHHAISAGTLFPPLPLAASEALALLPEALGRVRPLNVAQRRALPEDAAALSRLLTVDRADMRRPYWASPAFVSAYMYYFLPWNLLRLMRLFTSLPLAELRLAPSGGEALLADIGSGPLTLPMALWLARPDLEEAPLRLLALDSAPQPLELGKALFRVLGEILGRRVWPIRTERETLWQFVRKPHPLGWSTCLVTAANVLNERRARPAHCSRGGRAEGSPRFPSGEECEYGDILRPFLSLRGRAQNPSALLVVEPGTRLGGKTVMALREEAQAVGLGAIAPCTHNAACPLARRGGGRGKSGRSWCHFTFDCVGAPGWLESLSAEAGLTKKALSLSFLLLESVEKLRFDGGSARIRVISAPFTVPGLTGKARYACSAKGLLLLEDTERAACGDERHARVAPDAPRDAKSGAIVFKR
ncbi:MAG: hypothetical protein LBS77_05685 [Desulfovibrio sp.]|jgi:hypothetical protein|nr:hypothetical protein [Desulfovibrio sp.]